MRACTKETNSLPSLLEEEGLRERISRSAAEGERDLRVLMNAVSDIH